jgi:hypothetical protein
MSGDAHVRFWERLGVQLPGPTHPASGLPTVFAGSLLAIYTLHLPQINLDLVL